MTFDDWFDEYFVAGNIRGLEPMFLHERDRIIGREAWNAALKYAEVPNTRANPECERPPRPYEPGLD